MNKKLTPEKQDQNEARRFLFGEGAMAAVSKKHTVGKSGLGKFFAVVRRCGVKGCGNAAAENDVCCVECGKTAAGQAVREAVNKEVKDLEDLSNALWHKCAVCRGYDDRSIPCVQRDCETLYERATAEAKLRKISGGKKEDKKEDKSMALTE